MRWHCNALTTLPALSLFTAFDKAIDASNIVTLHVPGTDATESLSDLLVCRANDIAFFSSLVAQNIFMYGFISFFLRRNPVVHVLLNCLLFFCPHLSRSSLFYRSCVASLPWFLACRTVSLEVCSLLVSNIPPFPIA